MKKKSHLLSVLLLLTLLLTAGCGKQQPVSVSTSASSSATEEVTTVSPSTEPAVEYDITLPGYTFTRENFPRMDGSTASVPMGQAIASALLGETMEEVEDLCVFNRTTQSFRNLMSGDCDILVVGEPEAKVFDEMKERAFGYEIEEIATDALIFIVNEDNPVNSLTTEEIRDIYAGKITNWKEVGGIDAEIVPFQRNEGAGSQALMKKLVMGDTPLSEPPTDLIVASMGTLMEAVKGYDNSANAIGYSVYYYANDMKMATGLKILSVDGVEPCADTIRSRTYPHLNAYYCVIPSDPDTSSPEAKARAEAAKVIFDWLSEKGGQNLVASMGYVSILDVGEGGKQTEGTYYQLIEGTKAGTLSELRPRDDYGKLIPYTGELLYTDNPDGTTSVSGYRQGFFDEKGRLVTDPIYLDIMEMTYSNAHFETVYLPLYLLAVETNAVTLEDGTPLYGTYRYRFAAKDGSFVSEKVYDLILPMSDGMMCMSNDYDSFDFYDYNGALLFTDQDLKEANPDLMSGSKDISVESAAEGIYTVRIAGNVYFCDADTLSVVSEPYASADGYTDGTCIVNVKPNGSVYQKAGLLDRDGDYILEPEYDAICRSQNRTYAALLRDESTVTIFDETGRKLRTIEGAVGVNAEVCGFTLIFQDSTLNMSWPAYYSSKGELLYDPGCSSDYLLTASTLCSVRWTDDEGRNHDRARGVELYNYISDRRTYIESAETASAFLGFTDKDGSPMVGLRRFQNQGVDESIAPYFWVLNDQQETVLEGEGQLNAIRDPLTGKWYLSAAYEAAGVPESYMLYDTALKAVTGRSAY